MEATAGILRNHLEFWRSGPVRWILDRVGAPSGRGADRSSTAAARDRWQDIYWSDAAPRAGSHERPTWLEQPELWSDTPRVTNPMPTAAPVARPVLSVRPVPVAARPAVEHVEAPAPVLRRVRPGATHALRPPPVETGYAQKRRSVRTADIARYLQVNQAVHGIEAGVGPLNLPRRDFAAEVAVWRGREVGTPFLSGC